MKWITITCPKCRKPNLADPATTELVCTHCKEKTLIVSTGQAGSLTGETLGENYRMEERIGQGGFGEVYRARDRLLQRLVAIKVLAQPPGPDVEKSGRFLREAVTAAQIAHPNVVHIYDVGTDERRGVHYLVMEFVEGRNLKERVEAEGPIPEDEAAAIGLQVARGLAAAHGQGIVHRDIKPGNIMETPKGGVKITDFGLAKILQVDQVTKTQTAGSVAYMPPEQFEGRTVDERADLYALGATLYFLLSGKTPYPGAHDFNVMYNILNREPTPLAEVAPGVSADLSHLIRRLIEKEPDRRPAAASDVIRDLESFLSKGPSSIRPCASCGTLNDASAGFCAGCGKAIEAKAGAPPVAAPTTVEADDRTVAAAPAAPRVGRVTAWRMSIAVVVVGLGISVVVFLSRSSTPAPERETIEVAEDPDGGEPEGPVAIRISPEGERLLRAGDFNGYLDRGEEPLREAVQGVLGALEGPKTGLERIESLGREASIIADSGEEGGAHLLAGIRTWILPIGASALDRLALDEDPERVSSTLSRMQEGAEGLRDGPLSPQVDHLHEAVAALDRLSALSLAVQPEGPYVQHYENLERVREALRRAEGSLGVIGADAARWKVRVKREIRERRILPALRTIAAGEARDEAIYDRIIPCVEILAEIDQSDVAEVLAEVEKEAESTGTPIPWQRGG